MKLSSQVTYLLSKDDVTQAVKEYLSKYGIPVDGGMTIEPTYQTKEIPLGVHDCDYVKIFEGIKVVIEEEH